MIDKEGRLRRIDYGDRIFYDSVTGIAGVIYPTGTAAMPSSVIADVITICAALNIRTIQVRGALTLGATMENYNFIGSLHQVAAHAINLNGQDVDSSHIYGIAVTGAQGGTGFLTLEKVTVNALTLFAGRMRNCDFYTSTCSFRDASFINLVNCGSISGVVTITVQAPTRASIKNWRGNLILTLQNGGLCNVRGFKGTLEIDEMTAGTLSIYANGADITINADCTGGTINIYGNARVTGVGGGVTINNYSLQTLVVQSYQEQIPDTDFALAAIDNVLTVNPPNADAENSVVDIDQVADSTFVLRSLWVNVTSFGTGTQLTFELWVLLNGVVTSVDSIVVNVLGIQNLVDIFGLQEVHADGIWITVITDAGNTGACSGTYRYAEAKK